MKKQFGKKYSAAFVERAQANLEDCVNERVVHKLSLHPPSAKLVYDYLETIAKEYDVEWEPADTGLPDDMLGQGMPAPSGFSVPMAPASGASDVYSAQSPPRTNEGGGVVPPRTGGDAAPSPPYAAAQYMGQPPAGGQPAMATPVLPPGATFIPAPGYEAAYAAAMGGGGGVEDLDVFENY